MDAGPIAAQTRRVLEGDEKAPDLLTELFDDGTEELLKLLPGVWRQEVTKDLSAKQDPELAVPADKIAVGRWVCG